MDGMRLGGQWELTLYTECGFWSIPGMCFYVCLGGKVNLEWGEPVGLGVGFLDPCRSLGVGGGTGRDV